MTPSIRFKSLMAATDVASSGVTTDCRDSSHCVATFEIASTCAQSGATVKGTIGFLLPFPAEADASAITEARRLAHQLLSELAQSTQSWS